MWDGGIVLEANEEVGQEEDVEGEDEELGRQEHWSF